MDWRLETGDRRLVTTARWGLVSGGGVVVIKRPHKFQRSFSFTENQAGECDCVHLMTKNEKEQFVNLRQTNGDIAARFQLPKSGGMHHPIRR